MPEPDFTLKRHDTASVIQATLVNSGGTAVSVAGGSVLFKMAPISGGTLSAAGTATIEENGSTSVGVVHYSWTVGDAAGITTGLYAGEWEVTFANGTIQSFPNSDPMLINVTSDLPL